MTDLVWNSGFDLPVPSGDWPGRQWHEQAMEAIYAGLGIPSGLIYDFPVTGDCVESIYLTSPGKVWHVPSPAQPPQAARPSRQGDSLNFPPIPCNPL